VPRFTPVHANLKMWKSPRGGEIKYAIKKIIQNFFFFSENYFLKNPLNWWGLHFFWSKTICQKDILTNAYWLLDIWLADIWLTDIWLRHLTDRHLTYRHLTYRHLTKRNLIMTLSFCRQLTSLIEFCVDQMPVGQMIFVRKARQLDDAYVSSRKWQLS
jgi:hypothetical protein